MDIKELKEYVDAKIKENGRQEITGPILNKVLNSAIDTLDDTASAEVTEAVETLQNAIDSEASTRESADTAITSRVAEAVEKLQGAIDSEASMRESADTAITSAVEKLQGAIDSEATARETADNAITSRVAEAVEKLEGEVTAEASARTTADNVLNEAVTALQAIPIAKGAANYSLLLNKTTNKAAHGAIAAGSDTVAGGDFSFACGTACIANGMMSHAEGDTTQANGSASHAEGYMTKASGSFAHSEGKATVTAVEGGHAEGIYNEDDTNLIHSVGIGSGDSARKNAEAIYTDGKKYIYGVGGYDGTKASIANGAKDIATVVNEITPQKTTADIDTLTTAQIAPYYHNASTTISGTLPDGVTTADRFRLEVLPLGDAYVEQRMTVPTNGSVAVYTRVWNGSSWGAWV